MQPANLVNILIDLNAFLIELNFEIGWFNVTKIESKKKTNTVQCNLIYVTCAIHWVHIDWVNIVKPKEKEVKKYK